MNFGQTIALVYVLLMGTVALTAFYGLIKGK